MNLGGKYLTEHDLKDAGFRRIGKNIKIHTRASIYGTENITLGDNVRIDDFAILIATGNLQIGSHVHIANYVYIGAKHGVVVEDFAGIAHGSKLFTASDDYSGEWLTGPTVPPEFTAGLTGMVRLGRHVIIGTGSTILPGCSIGEGSAVGAMTLVNRDLESWGLYVGVPAKKLKDRKKNVLVLEKKLYGLESRISGA